MRIAIDIDSTLHHYWDQLAAIARRRFGVDLPYEEQYDWHTISLRPEQLKLCLAETHGAEVIAAAEPYPGAVQAVSRWHAAGHFVHITSHRPDESAAATEAWLQAIGLPFDELLCSWDKVPHCQAIGIDLLIDDSPVNLLAAIDCGMAAATIAHPWNEVVCETEDVVCATDWPELERRLAPLLASGQPV